MRFRECNRTARRDRSRWALFAVAAIGLALFGAWLLQRAIPRHIVLASGLPDGMYHQYAQRYKAILARDGVTIEERLTGGAEENERLLRDPASGVDVAFIHGGVVHPADQGDLVMLAALYYEPLWIFYRDSVVRGQIDELRHRRLAIGAPGSGVRAFTEPLLLANGISRCPASINLRTVLPHEGMLPVSLLSFSAFISQIIEGCGHVVEGCGGGQRKPRSGALSTVAAGAPKAHRPHVHGLPGAQRPALCCARTALTLRPSLCATHGSVRATSP